MFLNQLQTFFMCFPQTIYFIAMVFGVMTFGILSDIVGRKKARSTSTTFTIFTIFTIFSCSSHRPHDRAPKQIFRSNIILIQLNFPFAGVDTFAGVYEHLRDHHLLHAKLKKSDTCVMKRNFQFLFTGQIKLIIFFLNQPL